MTEDGVLSDVIGLDGCCMRNRNICDGAVG